MAPVLQCPECSTKHPLNAIGDRTAFPCNGCGRTLKVPEQARAIVGTPTSAPWPPPPDPGPQAAPRPVPLAPVPPPVADPHATQVFPTTAPPLAPAAVATSAVVTPRPPAPSDGLAPQIPEAHATRDGRSRSRPLGAIGLWIIAVPLAFIVVFGLAKAFGVLSTNDITDVALAEGWHRFVPVARLLPFVALAIAGFVQGAVFGVAKIREQRASVKADEALRGTKSSGQSSRTRA